MSKLNQQRYHYIFFQTARVFGALSSLLFMLMLLLMADGFTIIKGRMKSRTSIIFSVFFTVYVISYATLYIVEANVRMRQYNMPLQNQSARPIALKIELLIYKWTLDLYEYLLSLHETLHCNNVINTKSHGNNIVHLSKKSHLLPLEGTKQLLNQYFEPPYEIY